jgi:ELWxxDGT repeat protein
VVVKDINPGIASSNPQNLADVGGTLYFWGSELIHGGELWKSDGTEAGTVLVKDIYPGNGGSAPANLTDVNGTLFFTALDPTHGVELWKSDGTEAGTVLVKDINPGGGDSSPTLLTNVNGTLFFRALGQLWKSDGTAPGTVSIRSFTSLGSLTNDDGTLVFAADDGISGSEPWMSDGTLAGTSMIADLHPGAPGSSPAAFTVRSPYLLFSADDGVTGRELWAMYRPSTTAVPDLHPRAFALLGNHPNPFSRATSIDFALPRPARVSIRVYDLSGRLIRTLSNRNWPAGRHSLDWNGTTDDGRTASGGVYFCRMDSEGFESRRRMVLLR